MVTRRHILLGLGAGALAPLPAFAQQQGKVWRIGFLGTAFASGYVREIEWVRGGLRKAGYEEGRNIAVEYRWAEGNPERIREIASEFVALKCDAIIVHNIPGALAAARATSAIPIVMADGSNPVEAGLAESLARPGGNVTGSISFVPEESAKRLELLKEVVPRIKRVAVLVSAEPPPVQPVTRKALDSVAAAMKVELREFVMREPADLPTVFTAIGKARMDAVLANNEPVLNSQANVIAALAAVMRLPAIGYPIFADSGGLLAYGASREALYERVGYFVDRIFKGAKPAELPFERAARFDLIVNMKTARSLGITFPNSVLVRATRVIA